MDNRQIIQQLRDAQTDDAYAPPMVTNEMLRDAADALERVENALTREGIGDLETMIAKFKTVMLAANKTSIEQDEEIEDLKAQLAALQRREQAATVDLRGYCKACVHAKCFPAELPCSDCNRVVKQYWQWRGPQEVQRDNLTWPIANTSSLTATSQGRPPNENCQ